MKTAYPVIMTKGEKYIVVSIPDFSINTQGTDYFNAIEMARDAIGIMGIDMEDDGQDIPSPSPVESINVPDDANLITLIDVDFDEYRRRNEMRTVKKNCSIPSWLSYEAEKAGINFSQTLQDALKKQLNLG